MDPRFSITSPTIDDFAHAHKFIERLDLPLSIVLIGMEVHHPLFLHFPRAPQARYKRTLRRRCDGFRDKFRAIVGADAG